MTAHLPVAVIKGALQDRLEQLVRELLPGGRREANRWKAKNPTRRDREAGSFAVWLTGPAKGAWKDYASDDKGDVIDLVRYVRGGERADAIAWAKDWLGLDVVDGATLARMQEEAAGRKRTAEAAAASADAERVSRAFRLFCKASPEIAGTVVETYLARRGIPLRDVQNIEHGEIRHMPRLEWWKGARRDREVGRIAGPEFPAMVCAIRSPIGELRAVHCTFLAHDGSGKAPVDAPKLMFGLVAGCVIRLSRGPWNMTPEEARTAGLTSVLALGEGVEDGLSIALGAPEARVWAATSLSNLANVDLRDPCVSAAVVAKDNDWGKPQAQAAFDRAIDALAAHGKPIAVMSSAIGKDFNDQLRGEG